MHIVESRFTVIPSACLFVCLRGAHFSFGLVAFHSRLFSHLFLWMLLFCCRGVERYEQWRPPCGCNVCTLR